MFFAGLLLLPIWYGLKSYLADMSESGAAAGALACSFIAFTTDRLVLSQRENHMFIFSLLAIVVFLNYEYAKARVTQRRGSNTHSHGSQPIHQNGKRERVPAPMRGVAGRD